GSCLRNLGRFIAIAEPELGWTGWPISIWILREHPGLAEVLVLCVEPPFSARLHQGFHDRFIAHLDFDARLDLASAVIGHQDDHSVAARGGLMPRPFILLNLSRRR